MRIPKEFVSIVEEIDSLHLKVLIILYTDKDQTWNAHQLQTEFMFNEDIVKTRISIAKAGEVLEDLFKEGYVNKTVYRNNTTQYFLNKKKFPFQ